MSRQTLYRFFDAEGVLLYIGISMTPWERFRQHRSDKPWWDDIATITKENHPTREAVLQAERAAIANEGPRHNVMHNGANRGSVEPTPNPEIFRTGQAVALCMNDGHCHVGLIDSSHDGWISIVHKDWLSGFYWGDKRAVRIKDIAEIHFAEWIEPSQRGGRGYWNDEHFGPIQTRWNEQHFGPQPEMVFW